MGLVQNEEVIQALAADGADHPLHERVLPGRSGGDDHLRIPMRVDAPREVLAVDRVSIPEQVLRSRSRPGTPRRSAGPSRLPWGGP